MTTASGSASSSGGGTGSGSGGGGSGSGASPALRPPVTETQILPPQIPPQTLRNAGTTALSASTSTSTSTPAGSPPSAGRPAQTPVPPPVVPVQSTPVAALTSLVQETPVPAPTIPGISAPSSSIRASPPSVAAPSKAGTARNTCVSPKTASTGKAKAGATSGDAAATAAAAAAVAAAAAEAAVSTASISAGTSAAKGIGKSASKAPQRGATAKGTRQQQLQQQPQQQPQQHTTKPLLQQDSQIQQRQQPPQTWSPPRPPMSPVLPLSELPPHLAPTATGSGTHYTPGFALGRPVLTHTEATRAIAAANAAGQATSSASSTATPSVTVDTNSNAPLPPAPVLLDFSTNTDVIALQNTLAILQMQKKRATADIQTLQQAKEASLANPMAFLQQLQAIEVGGDASLSSSASASASARTAVSGAETLSNTQRKNGRNGGGGNDDDNADSGDDIHMTTTGVAGSSSPRLRSLRDLPKPQDVVRMPPINWDKYAIVGDGLERLHAEQLRRPPTGAPAMASIVVPALGPAAADTTLALTAKAAETSDLHAVYTFSGGTTTGQSAAAVSAASPAPAYRGIAVPYSPRLDHLPPTGASSAANGACVAASKRPRPPGNKR